MTIRTKNQVFLSGDTVVYGAPHGGYPLTTDFFCKMSTHNTDAGIAVLGEKLSGGGSGYGVNTDIGLMSWDSDESALSFGASENIIYFDATDFPKITAGDDCVMIVVMHNDVSSAARSVRFGDSTINNFFLQKNRLTVNTDAQPNQNGTELSDDAPQDEPIALYVLGKNATNAVLDYGWVAKTGSDSAVTESNVQTTITGVLDTDFTSTSWDYFSGAQTLVYSAIMLTYPNGGAPSLATVKEAAQWHVDNHTKAAMKADANLRVPFYKL